MMDDTINSQVEAVLSEDNEEDRYEGQSRGKRIYLKMLVPESIAGAVIGKGGKTISELQEESGARIKVSQASEFYPGSSDRTVMVSGLLQNVVKGQELIWQKISEVCDLFSNPIPVTLHVIICSSANLDLMKTFRPLQLWESCQFPMNVVV